LACHKLKLCNSLLNNSLSFLLLTPSICSFDNSLKPNPTLPSSFSCPLLVVIAVWMDEMRSDQQYDYMKHWHYINIEKEGSYVPGNGDNIIVRLNITYNELQNKQTLDTKTITTDLLILWDDARKQFNKPPEEYYKGAQVCLTGRIQMFNEKPEIRVSNPNQIHEVIIDKLQDPFPK
jgi:hypothetical protein